MNTIIALPRVVARSGAVAGVSRVFPAEPGRVTSRWELDRTSMRLIAHWSAADPQPPPPLVSLPDSDTARQPVRASSSATHTAARRR